MSGSQNLDVSVEVRVWEQPNNSKSSSGNDEFTLLVVDNDPKFIARFYSENPQPRTTMIRTDNLDLGDLPPRIASVMQEYIGGSVVNWPTSYSSRQGNIDRERATITIQDGQNTKYQFEVFDQDLVRITKDSSRIGKNSVPGTVLQEAQNFIPGNPDYIPGP